MINIFNVEPNVVSNDLTGYIIGIYGAYGCGKTTTASKAPKSLILATEAGYKAIPGVLAVDIRSWSDWLTAIAQLKKPEARERFKTIIIDTLDNLAFYGVEEVLSKNGVSKISDIPYGGGYTQLEAMFRKSLKELADRYGVIIIAHPNQKQEDIEGSEKKNQYWDLAVNKKVKGIAVGIMDMLIFVEHNRRPDVPNIAHFYASDSWEAKTRFSNIIPSTVFSYENIVKAVSDAAGEKSIKEVKRNVSEGAEIDHAEFEVFKATVGELASAKVSEKGLEPVKDKIAYCLGKTIGSSDIGDYDRLKVLYEELKNM